MSRLKTVLYSLSIAGSIAAFGILGYYCWKKYSRPISPDKKVSVSFFNPQILGTSKAKKHDVMNTLADIINDFDLTGLQEIRDKSKKSVDVLMSAVNQKGAYSCILSERLGRDEPREAYAFIYRNTKLRQKNAARIYPDKFDDFAREPFMAEFAAYARADDGSELCFDFVAIVCHTEPDEAVKEIHALPDVIKYARNAYKGENDIILGGDFNASGTNFRPSLESVFSPSDYVIIVPDDADTTVKSTVCAYDRIIILRKHTTEYSGAWGIYNFKTIFGFSQETAEIVSDHFPVFAEFRIGKDDD